MCNFLRTFCVFLYKQLREIFDFCSREFRGYQVRKHIKPLLQPNYDKLDGNTADFIRQYCKRWKAKTIFQVLLFYRAARLQDLVYFSQQVHLFNQTTVRGVNSSNQQEVSLDNIDPLGRATQVIGESRPSVWKLPFDLKDLTYFDTTYLCDPLAFQRLSADSEIDAWDAPLRRNNSCIRQLNRLNLRDQESQTTDSPHQKRKEYVGETYTQMPYCRDPKSMSSQQAPPMKKKASYKYKAPQPQPTGGRNFSPHPVSVPIQGYGPGVPRGSEKRGEKKEGWAASNQTNARQDQYLQPRGFSGNAYQKPGEHLTGKPNPIAEMETKYRQKNSDAMNEEPPFNFQAMLKKTNNNRASLRRVRDIDQNSSEHHEGPMSYQYNRNNERNLIYQQADLKSSQGTRSSRYDEMKPGRGGNWQNNNYSRDVITELAPGIIIQGQVADL